MSTVRLSSKGQVVIPKGIRVRHDWHEGQELEVIDTEEGLLLRENRPARVRHLDEVAGCLKYQGPAKSLHDMEEAIRKGAEESS